MARGGTSNSFASAPIESSVCSSPPTLESMLVLQAEDVDRRVVGAVDDALAGGHLVVVDVGVLDVDVGVAGVELGVARDLVRGPEGQPGAVLIGQPDAPGFGVRHRRL